VSKRRAPGEGATLSLDSFLDIVTNVVGVLILVALVTVLGAGDVSVASGVAARPAPEAGASRVLFECTEEGVFFVDEQGTAEIVAGLARHTWGDEPPTADKLVTLLEGRDVGSDLYRVRAEQTADGLVWTYRRRAGASGESASALQSADSAFQKKLGELAGGGFAYFVVRGDGFESFRRAREIAHARGIATGWLPLVRSEPIRLSARGGLGRRVQ
jgi:hypothetical protein